MFETIYDWMHWLGGNTTLYFLPFLLVIAVLVFVHEWGHFIVARLCGVKVETFSIGFGKRLFGWTDKGGTHWQVSLVPLGGYVKMFGDTDPASAGFTESVKEGEELRAMTPDERNQAFFGKPVWNRPAILFAGPAVNYLFALVLLAGIFASAGHVVTPPVAGAVIVGSAAEKAGIQPLDRILAIDGKEMRRFSDIQRSVALSLERPITVDVERAGQKMTISGVVPKLDEVTDRFGFKHTRGLLGIIGPGLGIAPDSIDSVDGQAGDARTLLAGRMDRIVTLGLKAREGMDAQGIHVNLPSSLNDGFLKGDAGKALQLAASVEKTEAPLGVLSAVSEAAQEIWFVSAGTLQSLGQMVIGTRSAKELGGIIRIGAVTGDAAQQGVIALLTLAAMLSVNLGLINLMPIPMLDGGHLVFYALEAVKGKPVPEHVQDVALRFGFVLLIALMVFANLNDLIQLSK